MEVRMMYGCIKEAGSWNETLDDRAGLHRSGSEWWVRKRMAGTGGTRTSTLTIAAAAASLEAVIG